MKVPRLEYTSQGPVPKGSTLRLPCDRGCARGGDGAKILFGSRFRTAGLGWLEGPFVVEEIGNHARCTSIPS